MKRSHFSRQKSSNKFLGLNKSEYFVNGDTITTSKILLVRIAIGIDRSVALDTLKNASSIEFSNVSERFRPSQYNIGGAPNSQMDFTGGSSSSFKRKNTVLVKHKSYKKNQTRLELVGNKLQLKTTQSI